MDPWAEPLLWRRTDEMLTGDFPWPELPPRQNILRKLPTSTPAVFQSFLVIAYIAISVTLKWTGTTFNYKCSNLNVVLLFQAALWAVSYFLDHYYRGQHRMLRVCGEDLTYKSLHRRSVCIFSLLSWMNALTIVLLAYSLNYASNELCDWRCYYSAVNLTVISGVANGVAVLCILASYINKVLKFRSTNSNSYMNVDPLGILTRDDSRSSYEVDELLRVLELQTMKTEFYQTILEMLIPGIRR
ncbi:Transmembrane protein 192 [Nesidiocoris tenuis]|uniref:Transmembrane protein 192 n=1 Tax=Nesidiocoris tenuis TaxID=355587 RepID=A0ABN7AFE8_9HEMI|nr:Transmembrane protein 192 [Nesidiocoris tenuis]